MITFITGGVKSGKSDYALARGERCGGKNRPLYFLATALPRDPETIKRIEAHRKSRKERWRTVEEPELIDRAVEKLPAGSVVVVDCVTLWAGNIVCRYRSQKKMREAAGRIKNMIGGIRKAGHTAFIVSNEVGSGIIPASRLGRVYCDFLGKINRELAAAADEAVLMVSGVAVKIKNRRKK
ncbi:MAG: bifunctional adenosylcobinamide kinase/adenosylcobinamide-phosphate guanylyltransferase [Elusimicrobia bacterium]|nr:bifunctional adenosylcobinamide kinase/adenosylcobinamide-phosphate guanylyltransferase [Elusimicrobiota bacterium]